MIVQTNEVVNYTFNKLCAGSVCIKWQYTEKNQ